MENALKYFENVKDPRSIRNQKHPFMTLIGTSLLASLAGIDSFSGYEKFYAIVDAIKREKQLKKWNRSWKIKLIEKLNPAWRD